MSLTPIYLLPSIPSQIVPYDWVSSNGPVGEWIGGPYPYLDTADGASSYVITDRFAAGAWLAVRLDPFEPDDVMAVAYQMQFPFVGANFPGFSFFDASLPFNLGSGPGYLGRVLTWPTGAVQEDTESWTYGVADYDENAAGPFIVTEAIRAAALRGDLIVARSVNNPAPTSMLTLLNMRPVTVEGRLAVDTHNHPFHVVGTRDPAMPYELVIDTGTQRLVEIIAGEEALATHELVIDETGRPGTPWTHCGLFRPL